MATRNIHSYTIKQHKKLEERRDLELAANAAK